MSTIYIDTRERERPHPYDRNAVSGTDMLSLFQSHRTNPVVTSFLLPAADFCFSGNGPDPDAPVMIGIERKRLLDLITSKRLGRYSGEQLPKLHNLYEFIYLVVEGVFRTNWTTGLLEIPMGKQWGPLTIGNQTFLGLEIDSFLNEISACAGVHVRRTKDPKETVEYVLSLHHTFSKPWDKHQYATAIHRPAEYATIIKASTIRRVAYALNGIAWEKSKAIEQYFTTIAKNKSLPNYGPIDAMIDATPSEWTKLPGFGKTLSNKIYKELHGDSN